jgi:hypothetical protein
VARYREKILGINAPRERHKPLLVALLEKIQGNTHFIVVYIISKEVSIYRIKKRDFCEAFLVEIDSIGCAKTYWWGNE